LNSMIHKMVLEEHPRYEDDDASAFDS